MVIGGHGYWDKGGVYTLGVCEMAIFGDAILIISIAASEVDLEAGDYRDEDTTIESNV